MSVITADEFYDFIAACITARQANRAHRRLRTRINEANALNRGNQANNKFGKRIFRKGRRAKARSVRNRRVKRLGDARIAMSQNHGAPRKDVIDIAITVDVIHPRTFRAFKNHRGSPNAAKSSRGAVDAARNQS